MEIYGNPWKSTDILRKFQQVFKMAENAEKQGFTFFAFLPAYSGVSGFLAYPKGKNFSRSIDWYRKFFISCPLARYRKSMQKKRPLPCLNPCQNEVFCQNEVQITRFLKIVEQGAVFVGFLQK